MNTPLFGFALTGALLVGQPASPSWESSYSQAQQKSAALKKPIAVFFGSGVNGWSQVIRDGPASAQASQLLAAKYLCVYVDTANPRGRELSRAFEIDGKPGVVLSNATGDSQAFWHVGKLTNQGLTRYLQKYAGPQVVVRGTETPDADAVGTDVVKVAAPPEPPILAVKAPAPPVPPVKIAAPAPIATVKFLAPPAPAWQLTYQHAQKSCADQKKPLAIVFGSGKNGWAQVVRAAEPAVEVSKLLADRYVCLYVDTGSDVGRKFAENFSISGNVGLVLSDRSASTQAFWHQGDLSSQSMVLYLEKYADPQVSVSTTETVNTVRSSYYPSGISGVPTRSAPTANC